MTLPSVTRASADTIPDEQVVSRILTGEAGIFELLIRRYNQRLFRVCRSILKNDDDAEDAMQEAYCQAFSHLSQFEGRATFATWLTRIAVYAALARVRKAKRETLEESLDDVVPEAHPMSTQSMACDPERRAGERELGRLLDEAIDALPEHYRLVFVLRAVEELSVAETAAALEIEEETVKTRLFRARALLKERLLDRFESNAASVYEFHLSRCDRVLARVFERLGISASNE
jgi:RNA polymerase sigma-70 factor (ECF subfamily)